MNSNKIVFLWSHVRSISTAFERAFIERTDYTTFHEPFGEPCYYGPERLYNYYDHELDAHQEYIHTTYSQIIETIIEASTQKKVFIKDMARHVVRPNYAAHPENPTIIPIDFLKRCQHTFILRSPRKSVKSLYRAYTKINQKFIHDDIGYPEVQVLFDYLTQLLGVRPTIIEADDLLEEPEKMMRAYCEKGINDRFEADMLRWNAERVATFDKWAGWHDEAQNSTGFNRIQNKQESDKEIVLPDDVEQLITKSIPIYETLYQFRLQVK